MTNKEFFGDKLLAIVLDRACQNLHKVVYGESCVEKSCKGCEFNTAESVENWLNAEHVEPEPPLLENGDGLKPGDWIMVRNCDTNSWEPRIFMCYNLQLDRSFVTMSFLANWYSGGHECWRYARLPMEGECK